MTPVLKAYLDLITNQHRDRPRFMATLTALLNYSTDIYAPSAFLDDNFDLDLANGEQEDILGEIVGVGRELDFQPHTQDSPILDDEAYRVLLKAKIVKNLWKGGIEDLEEIWYTLFGEYIKIKDNQNMTIEVLIENVATSILHELIYMGKIVPKPQSVRLYYHFIRDLDGGFFIGATPGIHNHITIRQKYADGGESNPLLSFGMIPNERKRHEVQQKFADGGNETISINVGMAPVTHKWHSVIELVYAKNHSIPAPIYQMAKPCGVHFAVKVKPAFIPPFPQNGTPHWGGVPNRHFATAVNLAPYIPPAPELSAPHWGAVPVNHKSVRIGFNYGGGEYVVGFTTNNLRQSQQYKTTHLPVNYPDFSTAETSPKTGSVIYHHKRTILL